MTNVERQKSVRNRGRYLSDSVQLMRACKRKDPEFLIRIEHGEQNVFIGLAVVLIADHRVRIVGHDNYTKGMNL